MNRKIFYAELRRRNSGVFGTLLSQLQVDGIDAILDECARHRADLGQTAYILATAYGETGGKMQPRRENMNYSARRIPQVFTAKRRRGVPVSQLAGNPKLLANTVYAGILGNRPGTDDGWDFRGAGLGQITGRDNFAKWGRKLNLPLVENPELLMDLDVSVKALVRPMLEGWATGKALPEYVEGARRDYYNARRVWNGTFAAGDYATHAEAFERALEAGRWTVAAIPPPPDVEPPAPAQPAPQPDTGAAWWVGLIGKLIAVFGRKTKRKGRDR